MKYPNTKGLIIRKTYPELLSNHIRKFFLEYPITKSWYNKGEKAIYYPNGSITEFSYLGNEDDVFNFQGREYEDISVDEITQHDWESISILRSSNRTTNKDVKPTMFLTGNPGGRGHNQVKRIFIDRKFREGERPEDYAFVQAFVQDNRAILDADPDYISRLENLPEHLKRAYLYGDWSIFAGQMFGELRESIHIVEPFELSKTTRYYAGYDYGFNHPFAFVLCALTTDGQSYVVSHIRKRFCKPDEQARLMLQMLEGKGRVEIYCGHDIFANRDGGRTIEDQLMDAGFAKSEHTLNYASLNHIQGIAELRKLFAYASDKTPLIKFFRNTREVFDCLLEQQINPNKPEDVIKLDAVDGEGGDDLYDALRMAALSWTMPNKIKEEVKPNTGEILLQKRLAQSRANKGWR